MRRGIYCMGGNWPLGQLCRKLLRVFGVTCGLKTLSDIFKRLPAGRTVINEIVQTPPFIKGWPFLVINHHFTKDRNTPLTASHMAGDRGAIIV